MKKILGVLAVAVLLIAGLIAPAAANDTQTCKSLADFSVNLDDDEAGVWGSVDWLGSPGSDAHIKLTVAEGYEVQLCLKKGSDGPVVADWLGEGTYDLESKDYYPGLGNDGFSHYGIRHRDAPPPPPPTQTVVFNKVWEGDEFDDSDVEVTFDVKVDGVVGTYDDGEVIEYERGYKLKGENVTGFPADCSWERAGVQATSGTDVSGSTAASFAVVNTVECDEDEEPLALTLTLVKDWDITDEDDLWDEADASYTLLIDGVPFETAVEVEEGQEIEISEDDVAVSDGCDFLGNDAGTYVVDAEDADEDGLITITVTNEVDCAAVLPTEPVEKEPEEEEPKEEEPRVDEVKVEKQVEKKVETEVLAESLPKTGASALLLSLLGLSAVGSGTAILRRRK